MATLDPNLGVPPNSRADGYGDNPRCHRRDVGNYFVENHLTSPAMVKQVTANPTLKIFQAELQNTKPTIATLHVGGHFSVGGDPGGDVYVSTNDPLFFLHHGMIDRIWWLWQNYLEGEVETRVSQYEGE